MANFCTKCGKPLVDGQPCTCESQEPVVMVQSDPVQSDPVQVNATVAKASGIFQEVKKVFVAVTKSPVTAGRVMIQEGNVSLSLVLMVLQGILTGVFSLAVVGKLVNTMSGIGTMFSFFDADDFNSVVKIPYAKGFIITVLISVILSLVLAGILLGTNLIFKNQVSYQQMMAAASLRSIFAVYTAVVSLVIFEIVPLVGVFCFFAGNLLGFFTIALAMPRTEGINEKMPYVMTIVCFIFALVSVFIMSKCYVIFLPEGVQPAIDMLKKYLSDPSSLLEEIL